MSCSTLFGKVPEDWTVSTISEIAELRQGLQISSKKRLSVQEDGSIPLLKITDLPKGIFSEFVKDIPENYVASKDDIIYTRTGQVGLVYTGVEGCVHNNCFKVIVDYSKFNKNYIYYYLNSRQVRDYANIIASGSVQKDLTHKAFKIVKVGYPKLEEQEKIANILSSLDNKIELNNEMNKTLEEMAQALFKRWFVDFEFPNENGEPYKSSGGEMVESELGMIPKGWEVCMVGEITNIIRGASPRPIQDYIRTEGIPWIKISDATQSTSKYICKTNEFIKEEGKEKSRFIKSGTLILSNSATPGIPKITNIDSCVHDGWLILDDFKYISKEFMYYFLLNQRENILNLSNGSVFRNLKTDILKKYKIILPNIDIINKSQSVFESINLKIKNNVENNEILNSLRDDLLPKLMSGEIRVK